MDAWYICENSDGTVVHAGSAYSCVALDIFRERILYPVLKRVSAAMTQKSFPEIPTDVLNGEKHGYSLLLEEEEASTAVTIAHT